jgi:23S rRNA pseudouridine1911/1915/1917 synthase
MKLIKIEKNNAGTRIDKFLAKEFFSLSRGEIIRNIKAGKILVNNKIIKPSYILKENDEISAEIILKREEVKPNLNIKLHKIYEDENILVINKPAGIQVHPDANERENTIANALVAQYPHIKEVHDGSLGAFLRPGIVHRLDKDTSGVLVIAKTSETLQMLKEMFLERKVSKKYLAVVYGKLRNRRGIITKPIARAGNYRKQVIAGAKTKTKVRGAVTEYKVLKSFGDYSLLEVFPKTGRMHQIRIHLFSIGHPIAGDKLYRLKNIKDSLAAKRQLLHASDLNFKFFNENYKFHAELPYDFSSALSKLDGKEQKR